jgi:hypothetical protein
VASQSEYFPFAGTGDTQTSCKLLHGWSIAENAGTPAVASVLIRDGGVSGAIVAQIELAANGSTSEGGLSVKSETAAGFYVDVVAGDVRGALYGG